MDTHNLTFGKAFLKEHLLIDPDCVFLNHGAYGVVPKRVFHKQTSLRLEMEQHPDIWYRRTNIEHHRHSLELMSKLLHSDIRNTVFVENTVYGIYSVLQSIEWKPGDAVLITNLTYNAVKRMCDVISEKFGILIERVEIKFPIHSKEQLVDIYQQKLQKTSNIKLAIIDHITSPSSVLMPVKEIVSVCRKKNVLTLVDSAHAMGQLGFQYDVPDLKADFCTGNLHKWMFTPRGVGYLWIDCKHLSLIRPAVVHHFHGVLPQFDFCVRGTRDDTNYYVLHEVVDFIKDIGGWDFIYSYNMKLLSKALQILKTGWKTEELINVDELKCNFQRLLRVPNLTNFPKTTVGGGKLEKELYIRFNIQTFCICIQEELYFRISVHLYNEEVDYIKLRNAVLELMKEPQKELRLKEHDGFNIPFVHWQLAPLQV